MLQLLPEILSRSTSVAALGTLPLRFATLGASLALFARSAPAPRRSRNDKVSLSRVIVFVGVLKHVMSKTCQYNSLFVYYNK